MIEQSGISKIVLYENVTVGIIRDGEGNIESILNNGNIIELNDCENLTLNYTDSQIQGKNDLIMHTHSVNFSLLGFDSYDLLDNLASIFGFIPVITFRNGSDKILLSPIFRKEDIEYTESQTQVYPLVMSNEVATLKGLEEFVGVPVEWVLEDGLWGGVDTYWTADGIWNTT